MITAKGITFGDGMTEIFAPKQEIEVFDINRPRRRKKQAMSIREILVLVSCAAPIILGLTFLTVMIRHTAFYIVYWMAVWTWVGLVFYANSKARRASGKSGRAGKGNHNRIVAHGRKVRKTW